MEVGDDVLLNTGSTVRPSDVGDDVRIQESTVRPSDVGDNVRIQGSTVCPSDVGLPSVTGDVGLDAINKE